AQSGPIGTLGLGGTFELYSDQCVVTQPASEGVATRVAGETLRTCREIFRDRPTTLRITPANGGIPRGIIVARQAQGAGPGHRRHLDIGKESCDDQIPPSHRSGKSLRVHATSHRGARSYVRPSRRGPGAARVLSENVGTRD